MKPLRNDLKKYCNWRRKFALLPHRCDITNRIIWLEYAQCAEPRWTTINDKVKFALLPRRCYVTNRIIWLEYAHCERPYWTTITNTVKLKTIWHDEFEHLNWAIINGL
jgi:hypothetical protein